MNVFDEVVFVIRVIGLEVCCWRFGKDGFIFYFSGLFMSGFDIFKSWFI